jgi:16S rRNA (uracil1498-N3)-methyltransferase
MPEIFLLDTRFDSRTVTIRGEKARYLSAVLRCETGDPLTLKDNRGNTYSARIISATKSEVEAELLGKQEPEQEPALRLTVLQGLLKGEKMDLVVQKATELGVSEIIPVVTERSQVRETRKLPRWKKIAEEASRQSGRSTIPEIGDIVPLARLLGARRVPPGMIFWEKKGMAFRDAAEHFRGSRDLALLTGPEGGFSEAEIEAAVNAGLIPVSMGKRILRAETASIAAVTVVQFAIGDLG